PRRTTRWRRPLPPRPAQRGAPEAGAGVCGAGREQSRLPWGPSDAGGISLLWVRPELRHSAADHFSHAGAARHRIRVEEDAAMNPLQSLISTGTKLWLDGVEPEAVGRNREWGATGATSNPIIISDLIKTG